MNAVLVKMDGFKTTRRGSSEREYSIKGIQTTTVLKLFLIQALIKILNWQTVYESFKRAPITNHCFDIGHYNPYRTMSHAIKNLKIYFKY